MADAIYNLKFKRGEDLPQSKLTEDDVRLINELVEYREKLKRELSNLTNAKIGEKFNVHRRTVERITSGRGWGHVG